MFGKTFRCRASLVLLANLLLGSLPASAQDGLPDGPTYRGEIRRGPDGRLTVQQAAPANENLAGGGRGTELGEQRHLFQIGC